jgi:hypothetical protein
MHAAVYAAAVSSFFFEKYSCSFFADARKADCFTI